MGEPLDFNLDVNNARVENCKNVHVSNGSFLCELDPIFWDIVVTPYIFFYFGENFLRLSALDPIEKEQNLDVTYFLTLLFSLMKMNLKAMDVFDRNKIYVYSIWWRFLII
uniref:Uncharacterized protein n=1 Tax=Caulerpa lentillifera TaxID=148947 RepID=A0A345HH00_9CHLO|nr:hypothetical protein [Caulerpa lentillifera]AXG75890.1 hypothetical protein [Caulerpa lentillifera]QKS32313.1 hypothetical protein [Caulerpa lentillifera]QUV75655.1 hypothetical protein [Caulerpa lentillifera]